MNISRVIESAFPGSSHLAIGLDAEIQANQNPMELPGSPGLLSLIPAYMQWAVLNRDNYGQLVTDWTLNALAEYGRAKSEESAHLNFKFLCTELQRLAVYSFLEWSLSTLVIVPEEQVKRAIKHWLKSAGNPT
jgi:hypothetical protein